MTALSMPQRVESSPPTRRSLLLRLRDGQDTGAWAEFVEAYGPLVYAYSRRRGLQDADAADLTQDVLSCFATHAAKFDYDPAKGTFRGWLFTTTRNKIINAVQKAKRNATTTGGTDVAMLLAQQPDNRSDEAEFQRQCDWQLFTWAAERVKRDFQEKTWKAFWANVVEDQKAPEIAKRLEISVGAVYIAKSRVLQAIREKLKTVE